jgi:hypothetical protein
VKDAADNLIADADVSIKKEGQAAILGKTDAEGVIAFKEIDPATYAVTVTKNSVVTNAVKTVETGTNARLTVVIP